MSRQVILTITTSLLAITSSLSLSCGPSGPSQFVTYTDEANGFSIDYPQGWYVQEHPEEYPRFEVAIWSKRFGSDAAGIMVAKEASLGHSLKGYSELLIRAACDKSEDYVSISTQELTINGIPAIEHIYTRTIDTTSYTSVIACQVRNGTVWILCFDSPQKSFDSYEPTFDTILNSFRLL